MVRYTSLMTLLDKRTR